MLYLVATPIGNLNDITSRALEVLNNSDVIACEDTRTSGVLLNHFGINTKTISYHNFNEEEASEGIIKLLQEGKTISLISDAGYPLVSDPGYKLVKKVRELGYPVSTIPGANAALSALCASGLDTVHFYFYGFLNSKQSAAKKELETLKNFKDTIIFYEAPHRINKTLALISEVFGERNVCIARELSKIHEEYIYGMISELKDLDDLKGEIVIVVEGNKQEETIDIDYLLSELESLVNQGIKSKEAIKMVATKYNYSKNELYDYYLKHKS